MMYSTKDQKSPKCVMFKVAAILNMVRIDKRVKVEVLNIKVPSKPLLAYLICTEDFMFLSCLCMQSKASKLLVMLQIILIGLPFKIRFVYALS